MRRMLIAAGLWLGCAPAATPPRQPALVCPPGSGWDGYACVRHFMVTDVRCPPGTAWNGSACAGMHVVCPAGARWIQGACVADVVPAKPADSRPADIAGVSDDGELFDVRGPTAPPAASQDPFDAR